ncbi:hypothetical protein QJS10_CPA05g00728 [Acorus calamus]|uniref:Uncharacterized protein n=1 Tax=Acorus calamus TaxID=4465 RepID=A0AAV9F0M8_ACOCL|nr:hypothetical protein QJS10_CPA05g00728 [Acorus calamus]
MTEAQREQEREKTCLRYKQQISSITEEQIEHLHALRREQRAQRLEEEKLRERERRRVRYMDRKMSEKCLKKALQCSPVDQLVDHGAQEELHPSIEEPIEHMNASQRRGRDEQERESRRLRYKRQEAMMTSEERGRVHALRRERRAQMSMAERLRERYHRQASTGPTDRGSNNGNIDEVPSEEKQDMTVESLQGCVVPSQVAPIRILDLKDLCAPP